MIPQLTEAIRSRLNQLYARLQSTEATPREVTLAAMDELDWVLRLMIVVAAQEETLTISLTPREWGYVIAALDICVERYQRDIAQMLNPIREKIIAQAQVEGLGDAPEVQS